MDRKAAIQKLAEEKALELIRANLYSPDPRYSAICFKLSSLQPLLAGKEVDEEKALSLLRVGFKMTSHVPSEGSEDEEEALVLLDKLTDKINGMGKLFLGFIQ